MGKKKLYALVTVLIVVVAAVIIYIGLSCKKEPEERELKQVKVGLSWVHEAQFAGIYWADQKGIYKSEGLKVNLTPYQFEDLGQELVNGKYDFVFMQADTLLQAREKGLKIKAVFADYQLIPTCYFSKKDRNITKPEDLKGKAVGVAYSERYPLVAMLKNKGINISDVNIAEREYLYEPLANGTYDVEAGWITDGDIVKAAIGEYNVIHPYDYGVNWYADLITISESTINNNPELVEEFLRATAKGWQMAIENPDEAALLTLNYGGVDIEQLEPNHLKFVLSVSIPLIHLGDRYIGWMEESVWQFTHDIFLDQGIMEHPINYSECYTMEFLDKVYGG